MNTEDSGKNIYSLDQARKNRMKKSKKNESQTKVGSKKKVSAKDQMGFLHWLKFLAAFVVTGMILRSCGML